MNALFICTLYQQKICGGTAQTEIRIVEQDIARYIEGQAPDETVQNVEKIKQDIVLGDVYEMWDVVTDKDRWWVITNLTNQWRNQRRSNPV